MFVILAAWLIRKGKKPFDTPQESDDPNATIASILDHVRRLVLHFIRSNFQIQIYNVLLKGVSIEFPPNRLKQGYGEHVVSILDRLADQALKVNNFLWDK